MESGAPSPHAPPWGCAAVVCFPPPRAGLFLPLPSPSPVTSSDPHPTFPHFGAALAPDLPLWACAQPTEWLYDCGGLNAGRGELGAINGFLKASEGEFSTR